MRRVALLLFLSLGAMGALAAPALAAGTEPVVSGAVNNASPSLPSGSTGVGMQAGPLSETQDLAVSGNYAYVPSYFDGTLTAVNLSNPSAPAVDALSSIGTVPSNGTQLVGADTVKVFGGVAYVLSKNLNASTSNNDIGTGNSLTMFDISGQYADNPMYLGSISDATLGNNTLFGAYGVAVATNGGQTYAYVAAQGCLSNPQPCQNGGGAGNNFVVINVTNPAAPTYVTEIHNPSTGPYINALHHPTAVVISGSYAYVTSFNNAQVAVIDISTPSSPQIVATIPNDANNDVSLPNDLAISGHYLLIDNQGAAGPIAIVDISNPLSPTIVGSISSSNFNNAYRIAVYGDFVYVAASTANTVSAIDISNPLAPRLAGFVTDGTNLKATTGVDVLPTAGGLYLVAASDDQPGETGADLYPPFPPGISSYPATPPFSYGSSGNTNKTGGVATIQVDPVLNTVTIDPRSEPSSPVGLGTANFSFSTADAVASVLCSLDGAPFGQCTSATTMNYTGLALGSHTFTVQSTDASGNTTTDQYTWNVVTPAGPPVNSAPPTITGTAQQGQTLTEVNGTWSNDPAYAYHWNDCDSNGANCQPISGATSWTYTPTSADVGDTIEVTETATNSAGSGSVTSSPTQVVLTAAPVNTQLPVISGSTAQGQTLTTSNGTWTNGPLTYTYAWGDCNSAGLSCSVISGATASTYTLTASDVGHTIQVKVFAHNSAGSTTAKSQPSAVVTAAAPPVNSQAPTITGTAQQGQTLTEVHGTWSNSPTSYAYQWEDCNGSGSSCQAISGASGRTYTATSTDVGHTIVVTEAATNSAGTSAPVGSSPTKVVGSPAGPPVNTKVPAISGTVQQGHTLTASTGTWTGGSLTYTYSWGDCSATGQNCTAISGATASTYTLRASDVGHEIQVKLTARNSAGSAAAKSQPTAVVRAATGSGGLTVKVKPVLIGTIAVGQTVSATHGVWSGSGLRYTYAWSRCPARGSCHAISRATRATYRPVAADGGKRLMVTVTATDKAGSATATSARTASVARRSVSLTVTVATASGQHVVRSGALVVHVRCRVSAVIGAYARIEIGKAIAFATARVMKQSGAGQALRVTLHLTRAQVSEVRAGLAHGTGVTARIYPIRAVAPLRPVATGAYRQIRVLS